MPELKFGKAPARADSRNLLFAQLVAPEVTPPLEYSVDLGLPVIPTPVFLNDKLPCCVISGRAHQTLRFEAIEQGSVPDVWDEDVRHEYYEETCGQDRGLVFLDSLKLWRKTGWWVGRKRYYTKAFMQVDFRYQPGVKLAIYVNHGVGVGLVLPGTAVEQFNKGEPWTSTEGPPEPRNGHYVYIYAYNEYGLMCVTWGRRQAMSWEFFHRYCDECYGVIDAANAQRAWISGLLDIKAIEDFLHGLKVW